MAPTRRTLLKTAGAVAVAGKLLKTGAARAAQGPQTGEGGPSLRGYTYCNLRSGLGVKQGDRVITTGVTLVRDGDPVKLIP